MLGTAEMEREMMSHIENLDSMKWEHMYVLEKVTENIITTCA